MIESEASSAILQAKLAVEQRMVYIITGMIVKIRIDLTYSYDTDVVDSNYERFAGLCDISCDMLKEKLTRYALEYDENITVKEIHGEQKHSPMCPSNLWALQHTWAMITWDDFVFYVDPTSSQFNHIYRDIPDMYVSKAPPKWYLPDRRNISFSNRGAKLNNRFVIGGLGIVEFLQYKVWGRISDVIRKIFIGD